MLRNTLVRIQNKITILLCVSRNIRKDNIPELTRLGTDYGGWWVPSLCINENSGVRNLLSFGIGHDVSFDQEMQSLGFNIIGVDPLEECCTFASENLKENDKTKIIQAGVWKSPGMVEFFPPKDQNSDSWSITNEHQTSAERSFSTRAVTISECLDLADESGLETFNILKFDVEGAERFLLNELAILSNRIDFLAIEMDFLSLLPFKRLFERIKRIKELRNRIKLLEISGLILIKHENFNFYFLNKRKFLKFTSQINYGTR